MTANNCSICGKAIEIITYQARSADEAPRTEAFCTNCMLDVHKSATALDAALNKPLPLLPYKRAASVTEMYKPKVNLKRLSEAASTQRFERTAGITQYYKRACAIDMGLTGFAKLIIITGEPMKRLMKHVNEGEVMLEHNVSGCTIGARIGSSVSTHTAHICEGIMSITETMHEQLLAPRIKLRTVSEYRPASNVTPYASKHSHILRCVKIPMLTNTIWCKISSIGTSECYIVVPMEAPGKYVIDTLQALLGLTGTVKSLKDLMPVEQYSAIHNNTVRAMDMETVPTQDYLFTCKPDGERTWLARYGCIWLLSRRNRGGRIYGWIPAEGLESAEDVGPVLDIEVVYGKEMILIDVLIDNYGQLMPQTRTIEDVLACFRSFATIAPFIIVREYFDTYEAAVAYGKKQSYPTDGVISIQKTQMMTIKLKNIKSIELMVAANGELMSSDGVVVASAYGADAFNLGDIVELRIKAGPNHTAIIDDILLRYDKTVGNSVSACRSILEQIRTNEDQDPTVIKRATHWCSQVREKLYAAAKSFGNTKRIILDIGTGRGQALRNFHQDRGVGYLLVEPDEDSVRILERDLQRSRSTADLNELIGLIQTLVNARNTFVIYKGTIESILANQVIMKLIRANVRCTVAAFSISYIVDALNTLASMNIPLVGCGYFYDGVEPSQYLINHRGVEMINTGAGKATVAWPGAKTYTEPAITTNIFNRQIEVFSAGNVVRIMQTGTGPNDITPICSKVSIITTRGVIDNYARIDN